MPLVFACIAPHGSMAIPEAKPVDRPTLAAATTAAMEELGRRFAVARPEVSIVLTPDNLHVEGAVAVVVAPARDRPDEEHVRAGTAIARAASGSSKRVALIASCDHGHGHDAQGPYGFTPRSKEFDDAVVERLGRDDLAAVARLGSDFA